MTTKITPELLRAALAHINPNLPRDEWARIGMAIKSEYPDDTGRDLFEGWSATADGYDAANARSTWRSIKAGGGVGIGTLLYQAKQNGFELGKADQAPAVRDPAELARIENEREQKLRAELESRRTRQADAAREAALLWEGASETGASPYLARKGIAAHGLRFAADGWLLVPVRDENGALWNVQRIAPERPAVGTDKLFVKGARKSGLWHWCGVPAGADVLLLAEGYATAASLHEATGHAVAVAFDAGNLSHVAKALRQLYPGALLLLCGDDDLATHAKTGHNPGRDKAESVARAVGAAVAFPAPLPGDDSPANFDFNDLHQVHGLDAVLACVAGAIEGHQAQATQKATTTSASKQNKRPRPAADVAGAGVGGPGAAPGDDVGGWVDPFTVDDGGVWFYGRDKDGNQARPLWLCSSLEVEAVTRDQSGSNWGYLLRFADPLGSPKQWAMPARMLSGDGGEYRAMLLNMGLRIATAPAARNKLTEFIQTRKPEETASCTDRIGWHGTAFVLPHKTIGDQAERIVFQSESAMENTFQVRGDVATWRDRIGSLCKGNSRLVFAVACAFAGPLLRPAGVESGGFHFRGDSSSGKTTALRLASSVYGGASYMQRWRTTDNALEAIAAQHCDATLILDELAQVEGKVAGECAYMLANEQSKARATRNGAPRARLSWRLLFLSAGELGLADHMAEGMKRARTGQEVRMADIPADAGAGLGLFENIHDFAGGAAFASYLARAAQSNYGAPGMAFIEWACEHADTLAKRVRNATADLAKQWIPEGASGQVERVGARFALVGVAGEMATEAGLTGWPKGESERGARACFEAWMAARGGAGNGEVQLMLRTVRRFLETHGEGRFAWWHHTANDHKPRTLQRAGFRRLMDKDGKPVKSNSDHQEKFGEYMNTADSEEVSTEFFVLAETFRSEVCQGFDHRAVCSVLLKHGCLTADPSRQYDTRQRLPGLGLAWCYRITPAIFELAL